MNEKKRINNFIFDLHSSLQDDLNDKKVLYIPMYSMREYDTGFYNLAADGNVTRFISKLSSCHGVDLTIAMPISVRNFHYFKSLLELLVQAGCLCSYELIVTDAYGVNAKETRLNEEKWFNVITDLLREEAYQVILFEPNNIGKFLNGKDNVIYWCPVSSVKGKSIPFIDEFFQQDLENSKNFKMYVCSKKQLELFPNAFLDNDMFNPELFINENELDRIKLNRWFVFHPFRQSDPGYQTQMIFDLLHKEFFNEALVLYTAPNNFEIQSKVNKIRVSSDRKTYYSILKTKPIVIYLENPDEIMHVGLLEFLHFGCHLIYPKNETFIQEFKLGELSSFNPIELEHAIKMNIHDQEDW